jgi:hypothetical protein
MIYETEFDAFSGPYTPGLLEGERLELFWDEDDAARQQQQHSWGEQRKWRLVRDDKTNRQSETQVGLTTLWVEYTWYMQQWSKFEQQLQSTGNESKRQKLREKIERVQRNLFSVRNASAGGMPAGHRDTIIQGYELTPGWKTSGLLGQGGAGIVVEVRHEQVPPNQHQHQVYACKMIPSRGSEESIKNEAEVFRKVAGSHVVKVISHFPKGEWYCIVMQRATSDLRTYLDKVRAAGTTGSGYQLDSLQRPRLFTWIYCLSNTLSTIHSKGPCHRDIKPANILLLDDRVLFTDFGLAFAAGGATGSRYTASGGDLNYAPPEAFGNRTAQTFETKETRQAGDVFSLGCVFFEMLHALSLPFIGSPFPAIDSRGYAFSVQNPEFMRQAWAVTENPIKLYWLEKDKQYPGLMESLLKIVLDEMMTTRDRRKSAYHVSTSIRIAMATAVFPLSQYASACGCCI